MFQASSKEVIPIEKSLLTRKSNNLKFLNVWALTICSGSEKNIIVNAQLLTFGNAAYNKVIVVNPGHLHHSVIFRELSFVHNHSKVKTAATMEIAQSTQPPPSSITVYNNLNYKTIQSYFSMANRFCLQAQIIQHD